MLAQKEDVKIYQATAPPLRTAYGTCLVLYVATPAPVKSVFEFIVLDLPTAAAWLPETSLMSPF